MKRTVSAILVCILLVSSMFVLTSCNMLMGTYEGNGAKIKFSGKNVTITYETEIAGTVISKSYEAEYKIEKDDDGKTITFTYEDGADEPPLGLFSGTKKFSQGDKDGEKFIEIGSLTYYKAD